MPHIARTPYKFASKGVNLTNPPDLLSPGHQPRLLNAVVEEQGALDCRAGSTTMARNLGGFAHTLRRLNNLNPSYSATDHTLLAGVDSNLFSGDPPVGPAIANGFSGNPLSVITFRPDQSTAPWAYIADQNRMVKVDVNSTVRNIGTISPAPPPVMELTPLNYQGVLMNGHWVNGGTASAFSNPSRVPASTTVSAILYDSGTTGWAVLSPSTPSGDYSWLQPLSELQIAGAQRFIVEEVHEAIPDCTIQSILYDTGASGLCSVTLSTKATPLERNSLIVIVGEVVRVLSVSTDTLGALSFRCSTTMNYTPGALVTGLVSIRAYTTLTVSPGDAIQGIDNISFPVTAGTGSQTRTNFDSGNLPQPDLSQANGIALGPQDYMHLSVFISDPTVFTSGRLLLDVDAASNGFTKNYYFKTFTSADLSGNSQWTELIFHTSDLTRVGTDGTRTLANVAAIRLEVTVTGNVTAQFDDWYVAGGFGPDVASGSPTGIYYLYRYRATATGTRSNPSPAPRFQLYPKRQSITLTVTPSADPQVDVIDIFRYDPNLQSANTTTTATIVYVATIPNLSPNYIDSNVAGEISANQQIQTNLFQPWPVLAAPIQGFCNVSGNTVKWVSGGQFPLLMVPGTIITLNSVNSKDQHQIYTFPHSSTFLELIDNGDYGTNIPFAIYSPVITGQPLPVMFGPLEGPTASFVFGLGDPANPGTLYWTNGNDPDTASDQNTLEITSPNEPLMSGCVWNTLVYVFSRDRVFIVRPSFDATGNFTFTFYAIPAPSGLWSRWAECAGIDGVYWLGRDGIYRVAGEQVVSITNSTLYPLFPHANKAGQSANGYQPVDMTGAPFLQLNFADGDIWFTFPEGQAGVV